MKNNQLKEQFNVLGTVEYYPSVSVIMPFEPKMTLGSELRHRLKIALDKVENELCRNYTEEKTCAVVERLTALVNGLDYMTYKKSVAIFVSPLFEKVYYLDIPVEEKIVIDGSFEIRDLVYSKKDRHEYLVLVLSACGSRVYLNDSNNTFRVISNLACHAIDNRDLPQRIGNFSDPTERKQLLAKKFLKKVDESLSLLFQAYPLPIFIVGPVKTVAYFKGLSKNLYHVVGYVNGNHTHTPPNVLREIMEPHVTNWKQIRQTDLLNNLDYSESENKLAKGIKQVWHEASHKKGRLLVVEKNYMVPARKISKDEISLFVQPENLFIKDAVDDIIEKVLEYGGDVEFVDDGLLGRYDHIALMLYF